MKNGILTSNSASNGGPNPVTITNISPWSLSMAASTIDRKFETNVKLGYREVYEGVSINTFQPKRKMIPLIYGGDSPNLKRGFNGSQSRLCTEDSLNKKLVKGKIVLCDFLIRRKAASLAGAAGTIMQDGGSKDSSRSFPIPASYLGLDDGIKVFDYLGSTRKPTATILKSTEPKDEKAPFVVSFSSRGPNPITNDILKPNLTALGVGILVAWSEAAIVSRINGNNRIVSYNIISGTFMSCPHATVAAAYIKSFHTTWLPAALKTTAFQLSDEINTDVEFAYRAGHIDPVRAIKPGLVYDTGEIDHIQFLCGQGYNTRSLRLVTEDNSSCSKVSNITASDLNYPSFAISTRSSSKSVSRVFHRTVTNVGSAESNYKAIVKAPPGLRVQVKPKVLCFSSLGQKKSFVLKVKVKVEKSIVSASLVWDDGVHQVRSPIVAHNSS